MFIILSCKFIDLIISQFSVNWLSRWSCIILLSMHILTGFFINFLCVSLAICVQFPITDPCLLQITAGMLLLWMWVNMAIFRKVLCVSKQASHTHESEKFITVCETGLQQNAGDTVTRQKMNSEAAIMNPLSKVIGLRCKRSCHPFRRVELILLFSPDNCSRPHSADLQPWHTCSSHFLTLDFFQCHRLGDITVRVPLAHWERHRSCQDLWP
jgi:hypothetical protein